MEVGEFPLGLCHSPLTWRVKGLALSHSECRQTSRCSQEEKREGGGDGVLVSDMKWLPQNHSFTGKRTNESEAYGLDFPQAEKPQKHSIKGKQYSCLFQPEQPRHWADLGAGQLHPGWLCLSFHCWTGICFIPLCAEHQLDPGV